MFQEPPKERSFPTTAVAIAAVAVLILVAVLVALARRKGPALDETQPQPVAPYAEKLEITNPQLSAASNLTGATATYIDGHVTNTGDRTVTGVTVQVAFANANGGAAQLAAAPMRIVRAREPEVDTVLLADAPLKPGAGADFRLIFENVSDAWDQKQPAMQAIRVDTR